MTKLEIMEFTQRIAAKLARAESSARPLSDERRKRIEEIRRQSDLRNYAERICKYGGHS